MLSRVILAFLKCAPPPPPQPPILELKIKTYESLLMALMAPLN